MPQGNARAISSVVSTPDSGNPPPNALPIVTTSGLTPECSTPQRFPVRPRPVIISSAISTAPSSSASARAVGRNSLGGTMLPAVPCSGSTMTAATAPADAVLTCLRPTSAQATPQLGYLSPIGQR